jgi:hypothetical protein
MKLVPTVCAVGLTAAATLAACSNANDHLSSGSNASESHMLGGGLEPATAGSVGMHLLIATGVHVNQLSWGISNGANNYGGAVFITDDAGHEAQSIEFVAGGIVAGSGYVVTLGGTDSAGDVCQGTSAPVTVGAGQTSGVTINVRCAVETDATLPSSINSGDLAVDAGVQLVMQPPFVCPAISGLSISPAEVTGCQKANLSATVTGSSGGLPTVAWTTSCPGAIIATHGLTLLGGPGSQDVSETADFQCGAQSGRCDVTLTVGLIGAAPDGGAVGQVCSGVASTVLTESIVCESGGSVQCAPGLIDCPNPVGVCAGCVDPQTDRNNCGGCGSANPAFICGPGQVCANGVCSGTPVLTPCTSAPCGANQVPCDGWASGVCTPEEQIIVKQDIARGLITGTQLDKTGASRSCYECLVKAGCLDSTTLAPPGVECGDLTGTLTAGASAGETLANACLDVVNCIENSTFAPGNQWPGLSPTPAGTCADDFNNGVANCFCGPALDDSTACGLGPASEINGQCIAQEYAGFNVPAGVSNETILQEYTTTTFASAMANQLFACAGSNAGVQTCPQCL